MEHARDAFESAKRIVVFTGAGSMALQFLSILTRRVIS